MRAWPRRRIAAREAFVATLMSKAIVTSPAVAPIISAAAAWADAAVEDALDTYLDALVRKRRAKPSRKRGRR